MTKLQNADERFLAGRLECIPPFTLPLGAWPTPKERVPGDPILWSVFLLNEAGERLCAFAYHARYDWPGDPDRDAQRRLLEQLADGTPDEPVEGETDALWRCLFATVRSEKFADGAIAAHALALVRIGNELRRRLSDRITAGLHPPHVVRATREGGVEAASAVRLPFEPQPWARRFRRILKEALVSVVPKPGHVLTGVYSAEPDSADVADTENVLLYNIGLAAFTRLSTTGIRFERSYEPMARNERAVFPLKHRLRFEQDPSEAPMRHWVQGATLARWDEVPVPGLSAAMRPSTAWWALRRAKAGSHAASGHDGAFGLRVLVHGWGGRPLNGLMKPLFDGVIAAFHSWAGQEAEVVVARLARQLETTRADVRTLLLENASAMLGARELVRAYRDGVAWNPQDERCLAGGILAGAADGPPRVSGELFALNASVPEGSDSAPVF